MLQETIAKDRQLRRWQGYVVPQRWESFTADDHAVWDLLFARQLELLGSRVVSAFLDGIDLLRLSHPGVPDVEGVFLTIVQNSSPWTFLGPIPVDPCPRASFDTGLDLFAPRSLAVLHTLGHVRRMLLGRRSRYPFGGLLSLHDQSEMTVLASRPTPLQVDGDAAGPTSSVTFRSVPRALGVLV